MWHRCICVLLSVPVWKWHRGLENLKTKRFHNLLSFERHWLDEQGSEDCHGRALWALGIGVGRSHFRSFQMMAGQLFAQALPVVTGFSSPRAWAFSLIGIHEYLRRL